MGEADNKVNQLIDAKHELEKAQSKFKSYEQHAMHDMEVLELLVDIGVVRIDYSTLNRRFK